MTVTVILSGTLQRFAGYRREHDCAATTPRDALRQVSERYPQLTTILWTNDGALRTAHRLFRNTEQLHSEDLDRPLAEGDRLEVITAIAGG
jgi:molybdopterin converting factor small subunit